MLQRKLAEKHTDVRCDTSGVRIGGSDLVPGSHYLVPSIAQSLKSAKSFFGPAGLKWVVMNHNLESKRPLPQLGLETLDHWASYVSTLCQPLGEGKVTPNRPTHLDHSHTTP